MQTGFRVVVGLLGLMVPALSAQAVGEVPLPRRDAKKGDFAVFPLGVLGGRAEVLVGDAHATVKSVDAEGLGARAGLRVGDRIVAAFGVDFVPHSRDINVGGRGPMRALGRAIGRGSSGELELTVARDTEREVLRVQLTAPAGTFYDGICRDLLATRRKDGAWQSRTGEDATRYVTALCGLALLGRGNPDHLPALQKVARYLQGPQRRGYVAKDFQKPAGLSNWFICASGIFLAEYLLATGDREVVPTVQHLSDCLAARISPTGRFGHGLTVGYTGRGFNVINTHAQLLWALAERAGCEIDSQAWRRSLAEIRKSTGKNGGVRYWTSQTGYWDAAARTGQMALALDLAGAAPALVKRMGSYLEKHSPRMREAHAMGSIGMIFGTAALARVNPAGWRKHMDQWRWYLHLMRQADGSAEYVGGKRNNGGDHYLRVEHVANAIAGVMLATEHKFLHLAGNDRVGWWPRKGKRE